MDVNQESVSSLSHQPLKNPPSPGKFPLPRRSGGDGPHRPPPPPLLMDPPLGAWASTLSDRHLRSKFRLRLKCKLACGVRSAADGPNLATGHLITLDDLDLHEY